MKDFKNFKNVNYQDIFLTIILDNKFSEFLKSMHFVEAIFKKKI